MLTRTDLLELPYTSDLTSGGIAYACRSLAHTYDRMGGAPQARLRRIAAGVAVELALRRYLGEHSIPFDVLGATPFTEPDRYDVALGGRRCDVKSFLITRAEQIAQIRQDPAVLLRAEALVPADQFAAEGHSARDLVLFAFCSPLRPSRRRRSSAPKRTASRSISSIPCPPTWPGRRSGRCWRGWR